MATDRAAVVLLVEPDDGERAAFARALTRGGYRVLQAADAEQALALSAAFGERIDLAVVPIVLPRASGADLAERLAADRPRLRALLTGGRAARPSQDFGRAARPSQDFGPADLLRAVRASFRESPRER